MSGALDGLRVAVTRATNTGLIEELRAHGADVLPAPLIVISDPESWDELDAALERLARGHYKWVLFTSGNAVAKVANRMGSLEPRPDEVRASVAVVGPVTAQHVEARLAVRARVIPEQFSAVDAARALGPGEGAVLLPRVAGAPPALVEVLNELGWSVDEVVAYRNLPADPDAPGVSELLAGRFDVITFSSPSAARNLAALAAPDDLGLGTRSDSARLVACIGPTTAAGAREAGFRVDVVAEEHTYSGLVAAMVDHIGGMAR